MAKHVKCSHSFHSFRLHNQSKEQILLGKAMLVCGKADQIFRPVMRDDCGIDGEVEFRDSQGRATGRKIYVQLKCGASYLRKRKSDGKFIFSVKKLYHLDYWVQQPVDVYLIVGEIQGAIWWMNITSYLLQLNNKKVRQIIFDGEVFNTKAVLRLKNKMLNAGINSANR